MHVYEMKSWTFEGKAPEGSWAQVSMKARVRFPDESTVGVERIAVHRARAADREGVRRRREWSAYAVQRT